MTENHPKPGSGCFSLRAPVSSDPKMSEIRMAEIQPQNLVGVIGLTEGRQQLVGVGESRTCQKAEKPCGLVFKTEAMSAVRSGRCAGKQQQLGTSSGK